MMMDEVPCLTCPSWPLCAAGFLSRPRPHGWPSSALLDRIRRTGCHVVAVGCHMSDRKDIEWRWSFSWAERELIHHMSDVMYDVMCVLKAIKNTHKFGEPGDDHVAFCSYYIKTACLWVGEQVEEPRMRLQELLKEVLDFLIATYALGEMPHYFIRRQNLIRHLRKEACDRMARTLDFMYTYAWDFILMSMRKDSLLSETLGDMESRLGLRERWPGRWRVDWV